MDRTVKLSRIEGVLGELSYPVSREAAADRLGDVTVQLADGETDLGELIAESGDDTFESADDLESEVFNLLPPRAVGEQGLGEGEG